MKTMKIFFAMSLAMLLFALNSNKVNGGDFKSTGIIRYQVIVHGDLNSSFSYPMEVFVSDGNGRLVAHPLLFVRGTSTYNFTEFGPQTGIRIARIAVDPKVIGVYPETIPDVKQGIFKADQVYIFNLHLRSPLPKVGPGVIE